MNKYAAGYLRVSDKEQIKNFSLQNQREWIEKKAMQEGYTITQWFSDEGESAKTVDRLGLKDLIAYCLRKENSITAVFVYKYDRLNRNSLDFQMLRQLFAKVGITLFSATEISGNSPEVSFVQNLLSAFSEFENTVKSQRTAQGMKKRFESGRTSSTAHAGYKKAIVDGKSLEVPDQERFELMQRTWKKIAYEQMTLGQAQMYLNSSHLFKPFSRQAISEIFANTFYIGILQSRKYGTAKGLHQPMIDEDVFYRARAAITGRTQQKKKRILLRDELPLKGILLCPSCSIVLTGAPSTSHTGAKHFYYSCTSRTHKYFGINADKTNTEFLALLKRIKVKDNAMAFFEENMKEVYEEDYVDLRSTTKHIQKEIETSEAVLSTLKRKHLEGLYDDEEFAEMKEELKIEIVTKKQLLGEKKLDAMEIDEMLIWMRYYLTHLDEAWSKSSLEGKLYISGSIFPQKLVYVDGKFSEPQLGVAYKLNDMFTLSSQNECPQVADYRTILSSMQDIYQQLHQYVQVPA